MGKNVRCDPVELAPGNRSFPVKIGNWAQKLPFFCFIIIFLGIS